MVLSTWHEYYILITFVRVCVCVCMCVRAEVTESQSTPAQNGGGDRVQNPRVVCFIHFTNYCIPKHPPSTHTLPPPHNRCLPEYHQKLFSW